MRETKEHNQKKSIYFFSAKITPISLMILLALALFSLSGCSTINEPKKPITINVYADLSSAEGSRYYNASLIFEKDELVKGWQQYESWSQTGRTVYQCILDIGSLKWLDKNSGSICGYSGTSVPMRLEQIKNKIASGEYKPFYNCSKLDTCYKITE